MVKKNPNYVEEKLALLKNYYSDELCDVVRNCIKLNPKQRATSEQLRSLIKNLEKPTAKKLKDWNVQQVGEWLQEQGLQDYVTIFANNHITGDVLLQLDENDLTQLIPSIGHRKKLKNLIQHLQ